MVRWHHFSRGLGAKPSANLSLDNTRYEPVALIESSGVVNTRVLSAKAALRSPGVALIVALWPGDSSAVSWMITVVSSGLSTVAGISAVHTVAWNNNRVFVTWNRLFWTAPTGPELHDAFFFFSPHLEWMLCFHTGQQTCCHSESRSRWLWLDHCKPAWTDNSTHSSHQFLRNSFDRSHPYPCRRTRTFACHLCPRIHCAVRLQVVPLPDPAFENLPSASLRSFVSVNKFWPDGWKRKFHQRKQSMLSNFKRKERLWRESSLFILTSA